MSANRGQKHHHAKITLEDVKIIRSWYHKPNKYFADQLGVSNSCISLIRSGKTWKDANV